MDDLRLIEIGFGNLSKALPECLPYLEKAAVYLEGKTSLDEFLRALFSKSMYLSAIVDSQGTVWGSAMYQVNEYSESKYLCVMLLGGKFGVLEKLGSRLTDYYENKAREFGCRGFEWIGREGWKSFAKENGYKVETVTYRKDLQ